ncbi:uncharacterized protein TNCV_2053371 [Trichonephila clavipes]|nr:uncharacterized protein TNCV_2053371 [Trichonephila clavipes]
MRAKTYCGHLSMTLDAEVHVQMLRSGGPSGAKPTVVHLVPKQTQYSICHRELISIKEVPNIDTTLRSVATAQSCVTGQGFKQSSCKKTCNGGLVSNASAEIESGFVAKDDLVPFRSIVQFPLAWHHSKRRRRWVDVKGSTRNGHHKPKCPSVRRLRMVREDTGVPNEDATCA